MSSQTPLKKHTLSLDTLHIAIFVIKEELNALPEDRRDSYKTRLTSTLKSPTMSPTDRVTKIDIAMSMLIEDKQGMATNSPETIKINHAMALLRCSKDGWTTGHTSNQR